MRLICEISRALNATREEQDSGLRGRRGQEGEEGRRPSAELTGRMLTRRHASLLIRAVGLQRAEDKLQLISTDTDNSDMCTCRGGRHVESGLLTPTAPGSGWMEPLTAVLWLPLIPAISHHS